jgi:hypothetical protein
MEMKTQTPKPKTSQPDTLALLIALLGGGYSPKTQAGR